MFSYKSEYITTSTRVKVKNHTSVLLKYIYEIINNIKSVAPSIINLINFPKKNLFIIMPCSKLSFPRDPL